MKAYLDLLRQVVEHGVERGDRTGTGTRSLFGAQLRFDLQQGFPAVTTKQLFFKSVVHELVWFIRGETNIAYLQANRVPIWDAWADAEGNLGPVYGKQWRAWEAADGRVIDQLARVVHDIRTDPESRRLLVSAWNVGELERMRLPPCHLLFQFYVAPAPTGPARLSCQLYQRSGDLFLGVPFNIASYALLTHVIAQITGLAVGEFILTLGDAHVYLNHLEQVQVQLGRSPLPPPRLLLDPAMRSLDDFRFESVQLHDYQHHPPLRAPVAV